MINDYKFTPQIIQIPQFTPSNLVIKLLDVIVTVDVSETEHTKESFTTS